MLVHPSRAARFEPPPDRGLEPTACEIHECFVVEPTLLIGEWGIELPSRTRWFFEDADEAREEARDWLERIERRHRASGAHAHVRHGQVLVNPATGRPTTQLFGAAPILDLLQIGIALDHPGEESPGFCASIALQ